MSSSQKTEYLGLNSWLGSDRPQRIDFVDDNRILDNAIKEHITNTTAHCTSTQKAKYENPYSFQSYAGTGAESKVVTLAFSPKFVMVFTKDAPLMQTDANGVLLANFAIAAKSNGGTGGVTINNSNITVYQSLTENNGVKYNLNKLNGQYCIIAFK